MSFVFIGLFRFWAESLSLYFLFYLIKCQIQRRCTMRKMFFGITILFLLMIFPISAGALSYSTNVSYSHTVGATTTGYYNQDIADLDAGDTLPIASQVTTTNGGAIDWSSDAVAQASFNVLGFSNVLVDGVMWSPEATDPYADPDVLMATATMTDTYTNTLSSDVALTYHFFLDELQLIVADYAGAAAGVPGAPQVSYDMEILGNGSSLWSSSATLEGGMGGLLLTEAGTDLGGTYFDEYGLFGYNFDFYSDILNLGTLGSGESYDIVATLAVSITTAPFELGGKAGFVDPGGFLGLEGFQSTPTGGPGPDPVPEPATLLLLGSGIAALAGAGRKKIKS
jgi:hypothetical protein